MQNSAWSTMRSYSRDRSVADRRLAPGTARRVLRYARPYSRQISVFLVLVVVDATFVVLSPLLLKRLVDDGVTPGRTTVVVAIALIIAGIAILDAAIGLIMRWYSSRIGEGLIFDLRTEVFSHVLRQPVAFFTRAQTGALVSRLNTDVVGAQQAFTSTLSGVVSNVVSLVLVAAAMLYLSWPITITAMLMLPLFLLPARRVGERLQGLTRTQMQINADLASRMTERFNVAGALLVKLFGDYRREETDFEQKAGAVRDAGVKIAMSNRLFFTSLTLVASLATALVYGVGGLLAINGSVSVGTLLALAALLSRLYGPLTALTNVRVDVMTALVSFERVFEVLDLRPLVRDPEQPRALPSGPLSVEFDRASFAYPSPDEISLASLEQVSTGDRRGGVEVLHDVSLTVPPGKLVAVVGASGAGKTTLAGLVPRLFDVTSGAVRVGGVDVRDVRLADLQSAVGVVTQEAHLFHDTVRANLLYARPDATEADLVRALRGARIWDVVAAMPQRLDTVVGDRGHRLSGGEKQRIALARLLLKAPGIVLLDEATAHLDSRSEAAVQRALDGALEGRTALVIAHRLSTVRNADLIVVLDGGRVVEQGRHEELIEAGGVYARLHRTQFAGQGTAYVDAPQDDEAEPQSERDAPPSTVSAVPVT